MLTGGLYVQLGWGFCRHRSGWRFCPGGPRRRHNNGARGCAVGELDWGPGGGFGAGRGPVGRGLGVALGGGVLRAKSRRPGAGVGVLTPGGPSAPLRVPHFASCRRTLGARVLSGLLSSPEQDESRLQAARQGSQWCWRGGPAGLDGPRRSGGLGVRGPPRADKRTKKTSLSKRAGMSGGRRVWPPPAGADWSPGRGSRAPPVLLSACGRPPSLGHLPEGALLS